MLFPAASGGLDADVDHAFITIVILPVCNILWFKTNSMAKLNPPSKATIQPLQHLDKALVTAPEWSWATKLRAPLGTTFKKASSTLMFTQTFNG